MATGTIKKVVADRGFGFITGEDGKDYFFHRNALADSLPFEAITGGERVEFTHQASDRGPRAINVRPVAA
jgi:CspA family cold shock protein